MPTIKELVDKVGSTNAADLAAIAYGPELLPALDAMIADMSIALPRRMAATPGHEMTIAEAAAIGEPGAAGEWVVDDLHASDIGQASLTFRWD